jgi:trimeric autotransporter adhesin
MSYNTPKVINVFYKEDRKPYDINGKSVSYFGEDFIGSNDSTKIRFYLQPNLPLIDFTGIVHAKRADGEVRFELLEKSSNELGNYFELSLNSWFTMKTGKVTLSLKLYTGDVTFGYTEEIITSIESIEDAIVYASDIFTFNVGYAPNATEVVPPFIDGEFEQLLFALSGKPDIGETIYVVSELPTLTGGAYDDQWFLVKGINSFGKLYHIVDSVAEEVELGAGTFRVTPSGNGDVDQGTIAGQLKWNEDTGTINMGVFDEVEVGVGESLFWYVKANEPISRGDVVQFAGNVGGEIVVKKAVFAEITNQPDLLMGVCLREIDDGRKGYILSVGRLNNVNTDAFSTPILYLSTTTNGALSSTKPTSGFKGSVSAVGRFSTGGGNNGFLLVRPNLIKGLKEATDVTITDIVNGEILRWNGSNWVNSDSLSVAEDDIDALETRADLIEGRLDVVEPIVAQHTVDISDLDNRIDFIEDNGGIDFIKVATFSALPTSGEVRNHRLFLTEDTKQLWEFDGTQYNETSPKNLSNIVVSSEDDTTALRVVADTTQDEDVVSVEIDEEKQVWIEKDGKFNALNEANFYDNVTIAGNLTINGTTTTVNTTTLDVEDNIITINKNQTGTPETNLLSGIEVERGDETNFQFVFQESSDLFKVGQVGDLQAVATRQDTPTDLGVAFFNNSTNRFETTTNLKVNASGQLVDTTIRNTGTTVVPLTINGLTDTTANLQEWRVNNTQFANISPLGVFRTNEGLRNLTGQNNSRVDTTNNGTIIQRNIADANSALRINIANNASTANIVEFQKEGVTLSQIRNDGSLATPYIRNNTSASNSSLFLNNTGTVIQRNIADANSALDVNQANSSSTGNIANFQFAGDNKLEITKDGFLTQNGTRLFSQPVETTNTFFGFESGGTSTTGISNTSFGRNSLNNLTSGNNNTSIGRSSGFSNTTGSNNTFVGRNSGNSGAWGTQLATANNSTAIGYESYTDASNQMVFGNANVTQFKFDRNANSIIDISTINKPIADSVVITQNGVPILSTYKATGTNGLNTFVGRSGNTTLTGSTSGNDGSNNTAIGDSSLISLTTGNFNTASGNSSLRFNTSGNSNTASGISSLFSNTTGSSNTAIGGNSLRSNTIGNSNTANGVSSLFSNTTGGSNTANGLGSLFSNTTGSNNVASGLNALRSNTTGSLNVALGSGSGRYIADGTTDNTTGANSVFLGSDTKALANGQTNQIVIGHNATGIGSNTVVLGNDSITTTALKGNVGIGTTDPATLLSVVTSSNTGGIQIRRNSTSTNDYSLLGFRIATSNSATNYAEIRAVRTNRAVSNDTDLRFYTLSNNSLTEPMRIRDDGRVGIGITTPTSQLEVRPSTDTIIPISVDTPASHTAYLLQLRTAFTEQFEVHNDGDTFNTNGVYGTISDSRIKENVIDARNYIDDLMKLRVVKYSLKEEKAKEPTHLGFIAQEVEQVFPKMVSTTKSRGLDDMKQIKMSVLIPMLVKTIQELNKKVEELEEKIK